jgi:hypothetical protein
MGLLDLAGNATLLYCMSEEAKEGTYHDYSRVIPDRAKSVCAVLIEDSFFMHHGKLVDEIGCN